jgi:hypothetical protein
MSDVAGEPRQRVWARFDRETAVEFDEACRAERRRPGELLKIIAEDYLAARRESTGRAA